MAINNTLGAGIVTVTYDGQTPWGEATPYVSLVREPIFYGGKWGQVAKITLTGQVSSGSYDPTGHLPLWNNTLDYPEGLKNLEKIRDDIIDVFSHSLKTFEFFDSGWQGGPGTNGLVFDNVIVESVDFPSSGYWGLLDFSIQLKAYEVDYFMAQGIMDAVDEFQATENPNGSITASHKISARGFDYTDANGDRQNGLANAIAWVDSRKGDQNKSDEGIYRAWWGGSTVNANTAAYADAVGMRVNLILQGQEEAIDRLTATYSVDESFIGYLDKDSFFNPNRVVAKRFTVDINESLNADFNVVTINGQYTGGKNSSLKELRDAFINDGWTDTSVNPPQFISDQPEVMLFKKAEFLSGFDGTPDINNPNIDKPQLYNVPIGFSVEEDETNKTIKIKATFDTNPLFGDERYYFDHNITVSMDDVKSVTKVTVDGSLKVRGLSAEKQFYLKKFLDGQDVMNFIWGFADAQHALIGKTCWECDGGNAPAPYWIRADIGDGENEADDICLAHPYGGTLSSTVPERCHDLNRSASTMTMAKNEVKSTLTLSASFNDEDTMEIMTEDPADETVLVNTGKDYGRAAFSVDVTSPIDYVKANASAQEQYNGHWAVQNFGIKTREKSNVKVNLEFREDAGVPDSIFESTLRRQAKEIQTTLNSMLDQQDVYDVSESINHKTTKGDKITHSLRRSYAPDEDKAICIDIIPVGDQKNCYICLNEGGDIVNSPSLGDMVFAYSETDAQELCDQKIGHDDMFNGGTIDGPLTVGGCTSCWQCLDEFGEIYTQVNADNVDDADAACIGKGAYVAVACDAEYPTQCFQCAGFEGTPVYYGPFNSINGETAEIVCYANVDGWKEDANDHVMECPEDVLECWNCVYNFGGYIGWQIFAYANTASQTNAFIDCAEIMGTDWEDPNLDVDQPCDFQTVTPTTTPPF